MRIKVGSVSPRCSSACVLPGQGQQKWIEKYWGSGVFWSVILEKDSLCGVWAMRDVRDVGITERTNNSKLLRGRRDGRERRRSAKWGCPPRMPADRDLYGGGREGYAPEIRIDFGQEPPARLFTLHGPGPGRRNRVGCNPCTITGLRDRPGSAALGIMSGAERRYTVQSGTVWLTGWRPLRPFWGSFCAHCAGSGRCQLHSGQMDRLCLAGCVLGACFLWGERRGEEMPVMGILAFHAGRPCEWRGPFTRLFDIPVYRITQKNF